MNEWADKVLTSDESQLVVIDIQDKLFRIMPAERRELVRKNSVILIRAAIQLGVPITVSEQYPKGLGGTLPELSEWLDTETPVVEKVAFPATAEADFMRSLHEHSDRKRLVVVGMETHICVMQTVLKLLSENWDVHVVEDACCSRLEYNHPLGLDLMSRAGAAITSTETVLFQWLEKAGTPSSKACKN